MAQASFEIALTGVTRFGLNAAVNDILCGRLGHPWHPNSAELRMEIDRVMKPYEETRQRQLRRQRALAERPGDVPERPEGWQDRARALMANFHKGDGPTEEEQVAALRAKYEQIYGKEALDAVKDRKDASSWQRPPDVVTRQR